MFYRTMNKHIPDGKGADLRTFQGTWWPLELTMVQLQSQVFAGLVDHVDRPEDNALPHFIHGKTTRIHDFNVFNEYIYTLYIYVIIV